MTANISKEISFKGSDLPDEDDSINQAEFAFSSFTGSTVSLCFGLDPSEDVMDASESDFPQFEVAITNRQFLNLLDTMIEVAEAISNYDYMKKTRK